MKNPKINKENLYRPTQEDTIISVNIINECKRLGLPYNRFDNKNNSKDELLAITLLLAGKKIPKELEEKLLKTRDIRMKNVNDTVTLSSNISNEEIEQWLNSNTDKW